MSWFRNPEGSQPPGGGGGGGGGSNYSRLQPSGGGIPSGRAASPSAGNHPNYSLPGSRGGVRPSPSPSRSPQPGYGSGRGGGYGGGGYDEKTAYGGYDTHPPSSGPPPRGAAPPRLPIPGAGGGMPGGGGGGGGGGQFRVVQYQNQQLALSNCLVCNPEDFQGVQYVIVKGAFPFKTRHDPEIPPGCIGASGAQRKWAQLSTMGDIVDVQPYDPFSQGGGYLGEADIEVGLWFEREIINEPFDADRVAEVFLRGNAGILIAPGGEVVFDFQGSMLKGRVKGTRVHDLQSPGGGGNKPPTSGMSNLPGVIMSETNITILKDPASSIKIRSSAKKAPPNAILQPNFKFEDMGIGGLDSEFSAIFRRAFASRIFPPGLVDKLGIQHVKGLLLYGPPGTGKTLMARQIGKMLNAKEPKIVNGPEILNKFVGASEENIRKLFADAEKEYKAKGDESDLHIIIFDELDAICKQRGSTGGGTGVGDSVVNQLLSKMDGVDQLNNILIIGMTNRLDMIDEALLRPGRLEVHMEISLPDENGRVQILGIHTEKMRKNKIMANDVDFAELAGLTKNFSGAEIAGLIKSATSFAFNRHVKVGSLANLSDDVDQMQVNRQDFLMALDEVRPAFGVAEEELQQVVQNGIIHFDQRIDDILKDGSLFVEQVRTSSRTPLVSVLVHGPPGSGKSALAATIATSSEFPFIKLITAENMVGMNDSQKIAYINKVFSDSYKSPMSVIVVDGLERILEWVPIGPRFSNAVLQALVVLFGKRPPKNNRLLILCTTSNRAMLSDLDVNDVFASDMNIPAIQNLSALTHVLQEVQLFKNKEEYQRAIELLTQAGFGEDGKLFVGIKRLLNIIEMARQDLDPPGKLATSIMQLGL